MRGPRRCLTLWLLLLLTCVSALAADPVADPLGLWRERFEREVDYRLAVPEAEQASYLVWLNERLRASGLAELAPQTVLLVDRSPQVQALFVLVGSVETGWFWLGASAVSTGRPGTFDHFRTPLGVFAHSLDNPDFRAEGTFNSNHIRGYGVRGMRVFDFGWVEAERGWGRGGISPMRLQMHATDPLLLEPRLGEAASKGCIRIAASLIRFIDRYGLIDHDYLQSALEAQPPWVLRRDREPLPWPGRYLVVLDSLREARPDWVLQREGKRVVAPALTQIAAGAAVC